MEEHEQEERGGDHDDDWRRERVFINVGDKPLLVHEQAYLTIKYGWYGTPTT